MDQGVPRVIKNIDAEERNRNVIDDRFIPLKLALARRGHDSA